jgi:hypothetical protein
LLALVRALLKLLKLVLRAQAPPINDTMRSCKWFPHTSKMLTWTYKLVNCIVIKNFIHNIFKLRGTI